MTDSSSMMELGDVVWTIAESAEFSRVDEYESYVMDMHSKSLFGLNHTGTLVARQLQQGAKWSDLVQLVSETYGVTQKQCQGDVTAFLQELRQRGLIAPQGA